MVDLASVRHLLRCIHEAPQASESEKTSVEAQLEVRDSILHVRFEVRAPRYQHFTPAATLEGKSIQHSYWGLWDETEVVELFLAPNGNAQTDGYFEFQISPENYFFTLQIFEPRKRVNTEARMPFERHVEIDSTSGVWRTLFQIPLSEYGWRKEITKIEGGLFAILGPAGNRSYWASFLPQQETPDYHLPERFRPLLIATDPKEPHPS